MKFLRVSGRIRVGRRSMVLRKQRKDEIGSGETARGDLRACGDKSAANVVFRQQVSK
jgi:hypothetical protein